MPFTIPWPGDGYMYLSEDWALCERAKGRGYQCWLDPSIRLMHYGEYGFTLEDLARPARPGPSPLMLVQGEDRLQTYILDQEKAPTG